MTSGSFGLVPLTTGNLYSLPALSDVGNYHACASDDRRHPIASDLRVVISRLIRRLRAEHSFSISHAAVLGRLEREGARTTSALRGRRAGAGHSRWPRRSAELAGERLVIARRPDPDDRRQTLIELTELGRETLERERARRDGWLAKAIAEGLSPTSARSSPRRCRCSAASPTL